MYDWVAESLKSMGCINGSQNTKRLFNKKCCIYFGMIRVGAGRCTWPWSTRRGAFLFQQGGAEGSLLVSFGCCSQPSFRRAALDTVSRLGDSLSTAPGVPAPSPARLPGQYSKTPLHSMRPHDIQIGWPSRTCTAAHYNHRARLAIGLDDHKALITTYPQRAHRHHLQLD